MVRLGDRMEDDGMKDLGKQLRDIADIGIVNYRQNDFIRQAADIIDPPDPGFRVSVSTAAETLIEECAEVIHAASKVLRSSSRDNPTPVSRIEAKYRINIELGDLLCAVQMLDELGVIDWRLVLDDRAAKMRRWKQRVEEAAHD